MSDKTAIVGRLPCGCIMAALIPGTNATEDKRDIRSMMRNGLKPDITTVEEARSEPGFLVCVHDDASRGRYSGPLDADAIYAAATRPEPDGKGT